MNYWLRGWTPLAESQIYAICTPRVHSSSYIGLRVCCISNIARRDTLKRQQSI